MNVLGYKIEEIMTIIQEHREWKELLKTPSGKTLLSNAELLKAEARLEKLKAELRQTERDIERLKTEEDK